MTDMTSVTLDSYSTPFISTQVLPTAEGGYGSHFGISTDIFISHMVLVYIMSIAGFMGNGLVLLVFYKHPDLRASLAAAYIVTQATTDFLVSIAVFIQEVVVYGLTKGYTHVQEQWVCKILGSGLLVWVTTQASTVSLVMLTANRYVQICHPHSCVAMLNCKQVGWIVGIPAALALAWTSFSLIYTTGLQDLICISGAFNSHIAIPHMFTAFVIYI